MKQNELFVITISRQLGSGGAYVGQQLANSLNAFYADREIIRRAAKQLSVLEDDVEFRDEKNSSFWQTYLKSNSTGFPGGYIFPQVYIPTDRELFEAESQILKHIAKERSAVIIGRCGNHIFCDHPNHLSIFLHADKAFRNDRIQKLYKISAEAAEKMITKNDKERAQYNLTFTGKDWTDARYYDISLDTSKFGLDESTELILKYIELN